MAVPKVICVCSEEVSCTLLSTWLVNALRLVASLELTDPEEDARSALSCVKGIYSCCHTCNVTDLLLSFRVSLNTETNCNFRLATFPVSAPKLTRFINTTKLDTFPAIAHKT